MISEMKQELHDAVRSEMSLHDVVPMLRQYKAKGISQEQMYSVLEEMREAADDEAMDDRILEIADFVAGFCSPHMKVYETQLQESRP